jgi:hypothetical protein
MTRSRDEGPNAAMHYNEILARRIVAEVPRISGDGGAMRPVLLHEVARRLKSMKRLRNRQCIGLLLNAG